MCATPEARPVFTALRKAFLGGSENTAPAPALAAQAVETVEVDGRRFAFAEQLQWSEGLAHADWSAVEEWVASLPDAVVRDDAWAQCERAWLAHLAASLGPQYSLRARDQALLLSSLAPRPAEAVLDFVCRTRQRVGRLLDGIARDDDPGHDIVILLDDEETYYRYVAHHYPEAGEFALSGGMCIHAGCVHFVAVKADLHVLEPIIAHETTHAMVTHLAMPAWLNEGLAVNTERQLCPLPAQALRDAASAAQMHERHRRFWGEAEIQQFWSGHSFLRPDEGNALSYDLARILVEQFAAQWGPFRAFVNAASMADGGQAAAREHLGIDLGGAAAALLECETSAGWGPEPSRWQDAPERGAFTPFAT
jgi:hypothetical protein